MGKSLKESVVEEWQSIAPRVMKQAKIETYRKSVKIVLEACANEGTIIKNLFFIMYRGVFLIDHVYGRKL